MMLMVEEGLKGVRVEGSEASFVCANGESGAIATAPAVTVTAPATSTSSRKIVRTLHPKSLADPPALNGSERVFQSRRAKCEGPLIALLRDC